ncbi:MAG: hypothetical protein A2Y69_09030 [Candidatus Aminicenantes bacterium RBG_13_59_9]|nr:MAG: hypothetical protein A2Y69_09030 [Candidatus Aminicenantes bacterium RBG_13_59_9]
MTEKAVSKISAEVKALRIVLITLLILYGLIFISFCFIGTRILFYGSAFRVFTRAEIRVVLDNLLAGPLYFFIAISIFKLISVISRGESFCPASPRHIRRIGYAVFGLALVHAIAGAIYEFNAPEVDFSDSIIRILHGGLSTVLLGFGFLVIARVLEAGVRLQQDQNLTV